MHTNNRLMFFSFSTCFNFYYYLWILYRSITSN